MPPAPISPTFSIRLPPCSVCAVDPVDDILQVVSGFQNVDVLLLTGDLSSRDALPLVLDCFRFIRDFPGEIPGASARDCGNWLDMNLPMANYWGGRYAALLENADDTNLVYPE